MLCRTTTRRETEPESRGLDQPGASNALRALSETVSENMSGAINAFITVWRWLVLMCATIRSDLLAPRLIRKSYSQRSGRVICIECVQVYAKERIREAQVVSIDHEVSGNSEGICLEIRVRHGRPLRQGLVLGHPTSDTD